ncbi:MAG: uroporphyrinogen-III synthase [Pseudomonadota bacterium]|nr:uroporphyrinogen-III synthase [Pseudomonadota bacterium]
MRPLIIVRPQPAAGATAAAASELGLEPVVMPLFQIRPLAWSAPDPTLFDGLLVTSANAIRHGGPELQKLAGLPVFAVGEASAAEARDLGFAIALVGGGGVDELLRQVDLHSRLLHVGGEHRRDPAAARQQIAYVAAYRAEDVADVAGLERIEEAVVALHSPRAAARLAKLAASVGIDISRTALAAISAHTALEAGSGWQSVETAEAPGDAPLLALAARLCQNPG